MRATTGTRADLFIYILVITPFKGYRFLVPILGRYTFSTT
jgi:hypothetical protein